MTQQLWDIPDVSDDDQSPERATPTLVSLHFIRGALRRRWLVCVLSPLLGLLLAIAFLVTVPVNRWLISRGKGHAVVHEMHHMDEHASH